MKITKPAKQLLITFSRVLPVALLTAFVSTGCEDSILFEKTNVDPHPPVIDNFSYGPTVITTGDTVRGSFFYSDTGSDIEIFEMQDTGGMGVLDPSPVIPEVEGEDVGTAPFFFPFPSGVIEWQVVMESNNPGAHTIKAWLEDSQGSISNVIEFVVEIQPYSPL
jgi:hypothetical protein